MIHEPQNESLSLMLDSGNDSPPESQSSGGEASYEAHPLATSFPPLSEKEMTELIQSIKANGLLEPTTIHQGKITTI